MTVPYGERVDTGGHGLSKKIQHFSGLSGKGLSCWKSEDLSRYTTAFDGRQSITTLFSMREINEYQGEIPFRYIQP